MCEDNFKAMTELKGKKKSGFYGNPSKICQDVSVKWCKKSIVAQSSQHSS